MAACPPLPEILTVKLSSLPMSAPALTPTWPRGMPGQLCSPNTASQGNRSNSPSRTICSAPDPSRAWFMPSGQYTPSSLGWKITWHAPLKFRVAHSCFAAAKSVAVWPSWPQACMTPARVEACGTAVTSEASAIGSASMSARRPTAPAAVL